jgi:BirA family transcriptional regulator, biotin operon repressor / biotin---[acetyl-CoA-carboxylase] ligase
LRPQVPPDRLSTLPLVAGVAVADTIELLTGQTTQLKWPNDVWLGDDPEHRKVAGILITSSLRGHELDYALVGVGVNVSTRAGELPRGATSVLVASGSSVEPGTLFAAILERFDRGYADFLEMEGRPPLDPWRARAALLGERVTVEDAGRAFTGTFCDVDADGALLLEEPGSGIRRIMAGDLVRGPTASEGRG